MVKGWKRYLIEEAGDFYKGSGVSRAQATSGDIPAVRYGELYTDFDNYINEFHTHISSEAASHAMPIHNGDILFTMSGETKEEIGKCAALISDEDAYAGGDLFVLRTNKKMYPLFLGYALNAPNVVTQRAQKAQGDAVVHISASSLKSIEFDAPEYEEQKRIADALFDVDELILNLEKLIQKKTAIREGVMQQLITGKKRLPGYKDDREQVTVKECGFFISGNTFPLSYQGETSGRYPFYKVSDLSYPSNRLYMKHSNNYVSDEVAALLSCSIIPEHSIIFAKIGAAIFLERKRITSCSCCIDNNMMAFVPNAIIDPGYMWLVFQSLSLGKMTETTALPSLSGKIIGEERIRIPKDKDEQMDIAKTIIDIDRSIEEQRLLLRKYRNIRSGMMNELLTGRTRLV